MIKILLVALALLFSTIALTQDTLPYKRYTVAVRDPFTRQLISKTTVDTNAYIVIDFDRKFIDLGKEGYHELALWKVNRNTISIKTMNRDYSILLTQFRDGHMIVRVATQTRAVFYLIKPIEKDRPRLHFKRI